MMRRSQPCGLRGGVFQAEDTGQAPCPLLSLTGRSAVFFAQLVASHLGLMLTSLYRLSLSIQPRVVHPALITYFTRLENLPWFLVICLWFTCLCP